MTAFSEIYQETRLALPEKTSLDDWKAILGAVGVMARSHQWWVGDAVVYGEEAFGDEQTFQAAEELGLEPHTLTNYRWVAASVAPSRRREDLSWSHHAEVARLSPRPQRAALKAAADGGWTVRQLRDHVALEYPAVAGERLFQDDDRNGGESDVEANKRLERIETGLNAYPERQAGQHLEEFVSVVDLEWLLRVAKTSIRRSA